jgi:hypothetical protein
MFAEYRSAISFLAASACRRASDSLGLPRRLPRALAAFRAADVLALMISRSCWATAARIWMVNLLAWGLSTATNSTLESRPSDTPVKAIATLLHFRPGTAMGNRVCAQAYRDAGDLPHRLHPPRHRRCMRVLALVQCGNGRNPLSVTVSPIPLAEGRRYRVRPVQPAPLLFLSPATGRVFRSWFAPRTSLASSLGSFGGLN